MIIIPHYNSYDSFKIRKTKMKEKNNKVIDNFIIDKSDNYGIVIEVKYNDIYVLYNNEVILTKIKKDLNLVGSKVLLPGDRVVIKDNVITNLIKRESILSRNKKDSTRLNDIGTTKNIASNISLAVIVVSAKEPPLHPKFIDRYLMILQNSDIETIICLNKCDLKTNEDEEVLKVYKDLGYDVIETSTYKNIGIDKLKEKLKNKQVVFVGNSGVGKSSLTNAIMDDDEVKTSHVSLKSKRGRHTTTSSKYYVWDDNSSIIDTPGIRSLDVSNFKIQEIQDYFPEFNEYKNKCKYKDCLHYNEPTTSCIIKQKVDEGLINKKRYESYLRIISDIEK